MCRPGVSFCRGVTGAVPNQGPATCSGGRTRCRRVCEGGCGSRLERGSARAREHWNRSAGVARLVRGEALAWEWQRRRGSGSEPPERMREARWLSEDRPGPHKKKHCRAGGSGGPWRRGSAASRWRGTERTQDLTAEGSAGRCREGGLRLRDEAPRRPEAAGATDPAASGRMAEAQGGPERGSLFSARPNVGPPGAQAAAAARPFHSL